MTTDIEIKAGYELDLAVAKAIGLTNVAVSNRLPESVVLITSREWDESRGIDHLTCEGGIACIPFQPSTDLNAAFAAAEKVGLFGTIDSDGKFECRVLNNKEALCSLTQYDHNEWVVEQITDPPVKCKALGSGKTPALAICAAILELHKEQPNVV